MAEIAVDVQKESAEKIRTEKLESSSTSNFTLCENDSQFPCSNTKNKDLSASTELPIKEINKNDNPSPENKNEISLVMVSDVDHKNVLCDNGMQSLKFSDNSEIEKQKKQDHSNNFKSSDSTGRFPPVDNPSEEMLNIYPETNALHSYDVELSDSARDLIQRLLNPDPQKRLRSLLSLQNIRFFKDVNFADIRVKKVAPLDILTKHFPNGPITNKISDQVTFQSFAEFESDFFLQ